MECQKIIIHLLLLISHNFLAISKCCPPSFFLPDLWYLIAVAIDMDIAFTITIAIDIAVFIAISINFAIAIDKQLMI